MDATGQPPVLSVGGTPWTGEPVSEQAVTVGARPRRRRWRRRLFVLLAASRSACWPSRTLWTQIAAGGHRYAEADAPAADVVLVLGAQVAPGGTEPMPVLRGRLDTAAGLVSAGRAQVILVSGDGTGGSGDETTVMTST